jgi:predicted lipoprotein
MAAALAALALGMSCGGAGEAPDPLANRKREVLANLAENLILPTYREFVTAAASLETAAARLVADPNDANRAAAQDAWRAAMAIWQRAELMQVGPAGMSGREGATGGMDLRAEIYAFPTVSTCRIDQETVEQNYTNLDAFANELVDVRGLAALEYLLFVASSENTCSPTAIINTDGSWASLSEIEIAVRRATYAHTLATLVRIQAEALRDAWEPDGGNFVRELSTAGTESSVFRTAHRAIEEVAGAMMYLDFMTKDMKVGEPAGIVRCTADTCLDQLESRWAGGNTDHVLTNLRTFQRMYLGADPGTEAPGIDDLLVEIGAADLAAQLTTAIADAIAAVEALGGELLDVITNDPDRVMAAYDAIGAAARLFKSDVVTVLDIELPASAGSDND